MNKENVLQLLVGWLRGMLEPYLRAVKDPKAVQAMLRATTLPPGVDLADDVAVTPVPQAALDGIDAYVGTTEPDAEAFYSVLQDLQQAYESIRAVVDAAVIHEADGGGTIPDTPATAVADEIAHQLLTQLTLEYLRFRKPLWFQLLRAMRFIDDKMAVHYTEQLFAERFVAFFKDAVGYFDEVFGKPTLETEEDARRAADAYFLPVALGLGMGLGERARVLYKWDASPTSATPLADAIGARTLSFTIERSKDDPKQSPYLKSTWTFVPREHGGPGLLLLLGGDPTFDLPIGRLFADKEPKKPEGEAPEKPKGPPPWKLVVDQDAGAFSAFFISFGKDEEAQGEGGEAGVAARLLAAGDPSGDGAVRPASFGGPGDLPVGLASNLKASFRVERGGEGAERWYLPSKSKGTRLELGKVTLAGEVTLEIGTDGLGLGFDVKVLAKESALVVAPGDADGFVADALPAGDLRVQMDLGFGVAKQPGEKGPRVYLEGGSGLEVTLPVAKKIGPVQVQQALLGLTPRLEGVKGMDLEISTAASVRLGPVTAVIDRAGFSVRVDAPEGGGNLGPLQLDLGYKAPSGIGLSIDAAVMKGGGYLFFDPQKAEYAGVLQLRIDTARFDLTLNAVGLLTTRLPDGAEGYSLLVMITADDFPPIPLPFNFTLNGVGGLFGLHRTVAVDVLRAGLKNKVLDAVLFPEDPLRNAPQLVSNLRAVFPPVRDQYVFGLLAKIGWGTPTRFTVDLGIVLDEPNPKRLIILGQFRTTLPSEKKKIVRINMDALGVVDFDQGEASALATLYDSRIKEYAISGDMAMKMRWKQDPTFILAVGGFHPSFPAPPGLPKLARVGIDLTKGDNPRVRLEAYLAVTSNTVQFGARVDFYVSKSGFSLDGHVGIDTLFQFSPFAMLFDFSLAVTLRWHGKTLMGVRLEASVSGPNPWHLKGRATFEVWIFSKSISFDETFGSKEEMPALPEVDPMPALVQALGDARNWSAALPAQRQRLVSLRDATGGGPLLVHPLGELTVRQQVVPLGKEISKFGNAAPKGARRFQISAVRLHDAAVAAQPVQDYFAAGQYEELSQSEQLARPSFELMDAGIRVATGGVAYGGQSDAAAMQTLTLGYETRTIDADGNVSQGADRYVPPEVMLEAQARLGASARAEGRRTGTARYQGAPRGIVLQETEYVVVRKADLAVVETDDAAAARPRSAARAGGRRRGTSYSAALEALRSHLDRHPEARGALQVVALHEAEKVTP